MDTWSLRYTGTFFQHNNTQPTPIRNPLNVGMAMYRISILNLQRGTPEGSGSSKAVYSIKASIVNFSTECYRGMCFRVKVTPLGCILLYFIKEVIEFV